MRRIAAPVLVAVVTLAGFARPAQAEKLTAAQCQTMLESADDARISLESMEGVLAELEAEVAGYETRILELQVDIRFAKMSGNDKLAKKLAKEKAGVEKDLLAAETLRPDIAAQVAALRETVDSADHQYIACIEQTLAG
jgi:phage shock protein A